MTNENRHLILSFFGSEIAADNAVESLKNWDKVNKDIRLGAIGVLVKDKDGKIKTHKLGGKAETHEVTTEALQNATQAAATAQSSAIATVEKTQ